MNVFCVDQDPVVSARWLCDQHVVKMPLESCQMLANCFEDKDLELAPKTKKGTVWKKSHFNHPCSKWVRESRANAEWLLRHAESLFLEKYERYPKNGRHFSHDFFDWVKNNQEKMVINNGPLTEFPVAIKEDKKCRQVQGFKDLSVVQKYREYYRLDKPFAKWKQNRPPWL